MVGGTKQAKCSFILAAREWKVVGAEHKPVKLFFHQETIC